FTNKILLITVAAGIIVNVLLAVSPLASAFGLCALNWKHWLIVLALSLSVIPVGELYKLFLRIYSRKHKDSPARSIVLPKPLRKMLRLFKKCVNIFGKAASTIKKPFARKRNVPDADGV
ncbi:MAG: cation transporting ATPase C-terminal domain-containing protein, partial [Clostridia bacterium]|nr:cation transporting ATPase C-terminal domain-containing protein [Clostridia bacterium]